ncbi:hypothetical protein ACLB2K_073654 [Fragaria x ananassa]
MGGITDERETRVMIRSSTANSMSWDHHSHPLHLQANDQPGAVLVQQPLTEHNYQTHPKSSAALIPLPTSSITCDTPSRVSSPPNSSFLLSPNHHHHTNVPNHATHANPNNHDFPEPQPIPPLASLPDQPRRSSRATRPPIALNDYNVETELPSRPAPSSSPFDSVRPGEPHPIASVLSYDHLSPVHRAFTIQLSADKEPATFAEASQHPRWVEAMNTEISALQSNGTWSLVALPRGKKPIGCRWVFKIKRNPDGSVERYKARLVAKGYSQIQGVYFHETFSIRLP